MRLKGSNVWMRGALLAQAHLPSLSSGWDMNICTMPGIINRWNWLIMSFACAQKTQLLIAVCTFIILSTKAAGIYGDMCPVQKQTHRAPVGALPGLKA